MGHTSGFTQRGLPLTGDVTPQGWGITAGGILPPGAFHSAPVTPMCDPVWFEDSQGGALESHGLYGGHIQM